MSEYKQKDFNGDTGNKSISILHNASVFSEIFVRLILFLDLAKPRIEENYFIISHNVKDSIFQIDNILSTETAHIYKVFIGVSDSSLFFMRPWVENSLDDKGKIRSYNEISVYVDYLDRISNKLQGQIGFILTESIKGWNDLLNSLKSNKSVARLEIDRKSQFILATNEALDKVKEIMHNKCKDRLIEWYGVDYNVILNYMQAVNEINYQKMKLVLETVDALNDEKVIKLFFKLTQCPYLDDFLLMDWKSDLNDEFVCKLSQRSKIEIIHLLIDFKKELEQNEDDEPHEKEIYDWCQKTIEKW